LADNFDEMNMDVFEISFQCIMSN